MLSLAILERENILAGGRTHEVTRFCCSAIDRCYNVLYS